MTQSVLQIGSDPEAAALPTAQLLTSLREHRSPHLRGRAAAELSRRYQESALVYETLLAAVSEPANRTARVLGLTTVSWLAAIAILEQGTPAQVQQLHAVLRQWDDTEKDDLKYYLRHTSLPLDF